MMTVTVSDDGWHCLATRPSALFLTISARPASIDVRRRRFARTPRTRFRRLSGTARSRVYYATTAWGPAAVPNEAVTDASRSRSRSPNRERNRCFSAYAKRIRSSQAASESFGLLNFYTTRYDNHIRLQVTNPKGHWPERSLVLNPNPDLNPNVSLFLLPNSNSNRSRNHNASVTLRTCDPSD